MDFCEQLLVYHPCLGDLPQADMELLLLKDPVSQAASADPALRVLGPTPEGIGRMAVLHVAVSALVHGLVRTKLLPAVT